MFLQSKSKFCYRKGHTNRKFSVSFLSCFFFPFFLLLHANSQASELEPECDEVLVLLQVKHIGNIQLPSIICGEDVYLSVTDLFDFLKVRNIPEQDFSSVQGYFISRENDFSIDEANLELTYRNKTVSLKSEDIIRTRTRLFLKPEYFEEFFGLRSSFTFYDLTVKLESETELPSIKEARRKQMQANIRQVYHEYLADSTIERNHPFFQFGKANWAINTTQNPRLPAQNRLNLSLGGLLAGGEFSGIFNYSTNQELSSRNQFYRWRYVNNESRFLRQVTLGKINNNSIATIFNPVIGVQLTNAPTYVRKSFGTYVLSDYTEPDWTVELYINNVLVDYITADASGFFSFDVPLIYGSNAVELRYFGPWGEERISQQDFSIPFNFLPSNEFEYSLSSGVVEDGKNSVFTQARFNYGISRDLSVGGGVEYFSSLDNNPIIPFLNTSLRLPYNILVSGEYSHQVGYRGILNYTSPSNVRLELNYSKYDKTQDAVRFSYTEERKAVVSVPLKFRKFSGLSRFSYRQNILQQHQYSNAEWLLSGNLFGLNLNLTTTAFFNPVADPFISSRISTSVKFSYGIVFVPQLTYEYSGNGLTSVQGQLKKQMFEKAHLQVSYSRNFNYDQFYLQIGFTYELLFSRIGLFSSSNKNQTSFSQSAAGSLSFDPAASYLKFNNTPDLGRGDLKFEPFLDLNDNQKRDKNEPLVEGMVIRSIGGGIREKSKDGTILFSGMEPYIVHHFILNTSNLNRIAWRVENETYNISVNPNQLKLIEIPVSVMGEVAGFVYDPNGGIGGIQINIFNEKEALVVSILSESDGYFSFLGLKSGNYSAQPDGSQMKGLEMIEIPPIGFNLNNGQDGDIVDDLEFLLAETEELQAIAEGDSVEAGRESEKEELEKKEFSEEIVKAPGFTGGGEERLASKEPSQEEHRVPKKTITEEGLVYKVQFLTSREPISEGGEALRGMRQVDREKTNEGYKYLWGNTSLPGEAARLQNELRRSGFTDAFIVHYYKGQRISVEEALSIRNGNAAESPEPEIVVSEAVQKPEIHQPATISETELEGLKFKVQVAASEVQMEPADARFMGMQGVEQYQHQGMFKYSLGNFRSFGEANQFKNVLRSQGLADAFVVPFQNNKRLESGQARGVIYFRDSSIKGIGGISLEISGAAGRFVTTVLSEADGSFVTPKLEPGMYTLRLKNEELKQIGMKAENAKMTVKIGEEGHYNHPEIEFFLRAVSEEVVASAAGIQKEGLIFRVQVLTSVAKLPVIDKLLKGLDGVKRYKHRGLYKYTVGESRKLVEIRKIRNEVLKEGFEDAFIVSFLNGVRINLQEMTGQVFVRAGREKQGLEGISIGIYNKEAKQITGLVSYRDGKFSFLGLKPGTYTARLDNEQLENLGLEAAHNSINFEIQRNTEGDLRNPLIFTLERTMDRPIEKEEQENTIEYRIQLAASNVPLGPNHPTLKGIENISRYQHNGMYKYTVGSTYSLPEAKELMEEIRSYHEFSIFIVGFKEGVRVIVLE